MFLMTLKNRLRYSRSRKKLQDFWEPYIFFTNTHFSRYSTFQQAIQQWPMNLSHPTAKYPINAVQSDPNTPFQHVIELMLLSTDGFAILLDRGSSLWYRLDPNNGEPRMCLSVEAKTPYDPKNTDINYTYIIFTLYAGENIAQVFNVMSNRVEGTGGAIPKPGCIPEERMFTYPSWMVIPGRS